MKLTSRYSRNSRTIRTYFPNKWTAEEIDISGGLSALTADLGTITAGVLQSSDWAAAAGIRLDLDNKYLKMGGSNVDAAGSAAGIFLGLDTSYKWYVGNGVGCYVKFDGTNLIIGPDTLVGAGTLTAGNVLGWAHASDITKMDGGDIYADSITATQIAATTITAAELHADCIEATHISTGAINASDMITGRIINANNIVAGAITAYEIDSNTIEAGNIKAGEIDLGGIVTGDLDDIANGSTYEKVLGTSVSAGLIVLSECTGDLDDVSNGSTYGRVRNANLSGGYITLTDCVGDLDDISNGSTYGRVALTGISAGKIVVAGLDSGVTGRMFDTSTLANNIQDWVYSGDTTYIDGGNIYTNTITATQINGGGFGTLTITSGSLEINTSNALKIKASGNILVEQGGDIILDGGSSGNRSKVVLKDETVCGAIEFQQVGNSSNSWSLYKTASYDAFYIIPYNLTNPYLMFGSSINNIYRIHMYCSDRITTEGPLWLNDPLFRPYQNNTTAVGTSSICFSDAYIYSGSVTTCSEKKIKSEISVEPLGLDFVNALMPVQFIKKDAPNERFMRGVSIEDVEAALDQVGYPLEDFKTIQAHTEEDGSVNKTIRYGDLLFPVIKALQEFYAEFQEYRATH